MKKISVLAIALIVSISLSAQVKKDTTRRVMQFPQIDSLRMVWWFENIKEGMGKLNERPDISAKDASERALYFSQILQLIGQKYQEFWPPKRDTTSVKK